MVSHTEEIKLLENLRQTPQWQRFNERPVAYFCAEYGLECGQRIYSGGLGILAGDVLREAGDRHLPLVAVGLYYRNNYVCPVKNVAGQVIEYCETVTPSEAGFEAVTTKNGERLHVAVPIHNRDVQARVWRLKNAPVPVFLLDTNCENNTPGDRHITDRLYIDDRELRLKQEIVLGIGGLRALEAMGIHPSVYHLNEGHSAMLALELVHHEMEERHLGFDEARQFARRRIVLTNHTLVPAGHEIFSYDLVAMLLERYAIQLSVPVHRLVDLGRVQDSSEFSMSMLAFRMAGIINAVSRLHAAKAKEIWTDHPMVPITNGVHIPTWDRVGETGPGPGEFFSRHQVLKRELLARIKQATGREWGEDALLVGWARRIVRYKRPLAIFEDAVRLGALARQVGRPVRFVFAGHPHPSDQDGLTLLAELQHRCDGEFADIAAFLPGYDIALAKLLVAGCDVWLNTPVVGFEACGTSGMKAALNGVLQCATSDGWIDEADLGDSGWLLKNDGLAQDFLDKLEKDILPLYFSRNAQGCPEIWETRMRRSRQMILNHFSATRMLREYLDTLYI